MQTEKKLTGYPSIDKPWLKYYSEEAINAPLPECTIYEYLWENNKDHLDDVGLIYFGRKITYSELFKNIDRASNILFDMGVKENDRILYLLPNIPETAYLLYGGSKLGAVSDYIDPRPDSLDMKISAEKILQIISDEKINHIVALDQCYLGMIKPVEDELVKIGIKQILIVSASDSMNAKSKTNYLLELFKLNSFSDVLSKLKKQKQLSKMFLSAKNNSKLAVFEYKKLAKTVPTANTPLLSYKSRLEIIVHTSGTSSPKPKPIPLTNDNLNCYVHQTFGANMPMKRGDKALQILPYFAAFGIVDVVHAGLCHGNCLIQIPEFSPQGLGKLVAKYKPQILIGAPTWFLTLFDDPVLKKLDLSFLTMLTYGGDSMEENDEKRINSFLLAHNSKIKLTKGHGMSETCGCASYSTGDYNKIGGIGIPMPNTTYAIVDPETKNMISFQEDAEYIEGELIISSPSVTGGTLDGQVIVPTMEYEGLKYIFTRDVARMYRDGSMEFLSRSDRSFTRFDGYKIKPYEIEKVIKTFNNVQNCVISPYIDEKVKGNMSICYIIADVALDSYEAKRQFEENLISQKFIKHTQMSSRQIPSKFRFCTSLPISKNGKIDYRSIANQPLDGSEITVILEETNISLGSISIV